MIQKSNQKKKHFRLNARIPNSTRIRMEGQWTDWSSCNSADTCTASERKRARSEQQQVSSQEIYAVSVPVGMMAPGSGRCEQDARGKRRKREGGVLLKYRKPRLSDVVSSASVPLRRIQNFDFYGTARVRYRRSLFRTDFDAAKFGIRQSEVTSALLPSVGDVKRAAITFLRAYFPTASGNWSIKANDGTCEMPFKKIRVKIRECSGGIGLWCAKLHSIFQGNFIEFERINFRMELLSMNAMTTGTIGYQSHWMTNLRTVEVTDILYWSIKQK